MATALEIPRVGVGVILTHSEGQEVLVGRRKGGLEPDVWALPGGHLEHGETFEQCAERELLEETGLRMEHTHFVWACNTVFESKDHYVTVFVQGTPADANAQPEVTEPDKCHEWKWVPFSDIPQPWFSPLRTLLESGFEPRADKSSMNVRLSEVVVSESARSGHNTPFETPGNNEDDAWETPALEIAAAVQPTGHSTTSYVGHTVQRGPRENPPDEDADADGSGDQEPQDGGGGGVGGGIVLMGDTVVPAVRSSFQQQR